MYIWLIVLSELLFDPYLIRTVTAQEEGKADLGLSGVLLLYYTKE